MLFNSVKFLAFFAVFLPIYFLTPSTRRWVPILIGSYLFYMAWNVSLSILLLALTVNAYVAALLIERTQSSTLRKSLLTLSITAELIPLFVFKYLNFAIVTLNDLNTYAHSPLTFPLIDLMLPVGISFHTFQMIGYLVDVWGGRVAPERHFGRFACFVVFFPQLVAGPIERSYHMLPQFWRPTRLEYDRVRDGVFQTIWGMSKKVCVADLLAPFVAGVYAEPRLFNGSYLLLATMLFTVQIYCDFSGYSDMALGIAKILGYDLLVNFRQPYYSTSLSEFWGRWHISLSTWFREYLYIPLGGNRAGRARWMFNILFVFMISGIWHGAAWTFVAWGLLHGVWLLIEAGASRLNARRLVPQSLRPFAGWLLTLSVVAVGWVFFRARTLGDATYIVRHLLDFGPLEYGTFKLLGLPSFELILAALQIALLFAVDAALRFRPARLIGLWQIQSVRWTLAMALVYNIILFGVFEKVNFIYFEF